MKVAIPFVAASAWTAACADVLGEVRVDPGAPADATQRVPAETQLPIGGLDGGREAAVPDAAAAPEPLRTVCELGDFRCQGNQVLYCAGPGTWVIWQVCDSPALCESEPAGRCLPSACEAGEQRCEGAELQRCNSELTGWETVAACATAAHCDPGSEACLAAPCELGQRRCNRGELQQCRDDQLDWDVLEACATQALCRRTLTRCEMSPDTCAGDALACEPPACEPEQKDCNGARLRQCNRGRAGFNLLEQCANAALCEASLASGQAGCLPPTCEMRQRRCSEPGVLERCRGDRTGFELVEQCRSRALCNAEAGRCDPAVCEPGAYQCTSSGELLSCNADLTGFVALAPAVICDPPSRCEAELGRCRRPPDDD